MRTFTTEEFRQLTGVPHSSLYMLRRVGLNPVVRRRGRGMNSEWSSLQVLGISVGRALRHVGVSSSFATAVSKYIMAMTEEQLEAEFTAGKTHVGVIGEWAFASLSAANEILENKAIIEKSLATVGIPPIAVDVQRMWNNLKAIASKMDQAKEVVQKNVQPQIDQPSKVGT